MELKTEKSRLIEQLKAQITDKRVLAAMERIPRECFVPDRYEFAAYHNEALPIGHDQTISQPLIIAMMTEALKLTGKEKVLEIGTGSGYQTAILAELAREVITTERILELSESARKILNLLGYANIRFQVTPDELGWKAGAPYEAIMVTAAAPRLPQTLIDQMAISGRMVIPVGSRDLQELLVITRLEDHNLVHRLCDCRFVPLIHRDAWNI